MRRFSGGLPEVYLIVQGMLIISQLALPSLVHAATDNRVVINDGISVQLASDEAPEAVVGLLGEAETTKQNYLEHQRALTQQLERLNQSKAALIEQQAFYQKSANSLQTDIRKANFLTPASFSATDTVVQQYRRDNYFLKVAGHIRANKPLSPLLNKLEVLHCAQKKDEAEGLLNQLFNISQKGVGWPDEWLRQQSGEARLYAGSMDIALSTLHRTIERFPELTELSERVALQWDYCPLLSDSGGFYDLQFKGEQVFSSPAEATVPLSWSGLRRWGFLDKPGDDDGRYVPDLLDIYSPYYAYEIFLHRIHQQRCFPHPTTGKFYVDTQQDHLQNAEVYPRPVEPEVQQYPFDWHPYCELPKVAHREQALWPQHLLQRVSDKAKQVKQSLAEADTSIQRLKQQQSVEQAEYQLDLKELAQQISFQLELEKRRKEEIEALALQEVLRKQKEEREQEQEEKRQQLALAEQRRIEAETERQRLLAVEVEKKRLAELKIRERRIAAEKVKTEKARLAAIAAEKRRWTALKAQERRIAAEKAEAEKRRKQLEKSKRDFAAMSEPPDAFIPIPEFGGFGAAPVVSPKPAAKSKSKDKKLGITATFLHVLPANGSDQSTKLALSWKPAPNWFTRASVTQVHGGDFSYNWGVGYSDWRPGTTSVQLNNWGPIKRGEGLAFDKAILSVSHKIDSEFLRGYDISTTLGMSTPISGDLGMNATFQWSPIENWYFRTTASQKVKGGPTNWSYAFGHYNWRPETWRVEYSNYKTNRYPFDNFREGSVTISRAWEF